VYQSQWDGSSLAAGADSAETRGATGADIPAPAAAAKPGWHASTRTTAMAKLPASAHTQLFRQRIKMSLAKMQLPRERAIPPAPALRTLRGATQSPKIDTPAYNWC
jgi:hypothetical protein